LTPIVSALILIFILGVLITAHEWGHFIMARLTGIQVNEFAIGMGPVIWSRQKKNAEGEPVGTKFSLRALPIGGFCAMEGEDEGSGNPRAFNNRPRWARFLTLIAGSGMNFLLGFVLLLIFYGTMIGGGVVGTQIMDLAEGFPLEGEQGLLPGDEFVEVNGHDIYNYMDLSLFLDRGEGEPYDLKLRRGGQTVVLNDLPLQRRDYGDGQPRFGFQFGYEEMTPLNALRHSFFGSVDYVRLVWVSLGDLVTGRAGIGEMMGPVGMGGEINTLVSGTGEGVNFFTKLMDLMMLAALIAVNLAVMNLLPLPALDGGRIVFVGVEAIRRKPINPKYEGYVHAAGMVLFLLLMVFVFFNDIVRLVTGSAIGA
jgi:regulator of sigma E protease